MRALGDSDANAQQRDRILLFHAQAGVLRDLPQRGQEAPRKVCLRVRWPAERREMHTVEWKGSSSGIEIWWRDDRRLIDRSVLLRDFRNKSA